MEQNPVYMKGRIKNAGTPHLSLFVLIVLTISYTSDTLDNFINIGVMYLTPFRLVFISILFLAFCLTLLRPGLQLTVKGIEKKLMRTISIFVLLLLVSGILNRSLSFSIKKSLSVGIQLYSSVGLSIFLNNVFGVSKRNEIKRSMEIGTIFIGISLVSIGLYQEVTNSVWWGDRDYRNWILPPHLRVTSLFYDPNFYGVALIIPLFVNFGLKYTGINKTDWLIRAMVSAYLLIGVNTTGSQGVFISIIFGMFSGHFLRSRRWIGKIGIGISLIIGAIGVIISNAKILVMYLGKSMIFATFLPRLLSWYAGIIALRSSPILGIGPGRYEHLEKAAMVSSIYSFPNSEALDTLAAHSVYIETLVEGGFISLLIYLYYLFTLLKSARTLSLENELVNLPSALLAIMLMTATISYYPSFLYVTFGIIIYLYSTKFEKQTTSIRTVHLGVRN